MLTLEKLGEGMVCIYFYNFFCKCKTIWILKKALAGVAQWIEHWPANQKVASSIPSQGTCLRSGPGAQLRVCVRQWSIDVSLPLFVPPFPSL